MLAFFVCGPTSHTSSDAARREDEEQESVPYLTLLRELDVWIVRNEVDKILQKHQNVSKGGQE